MVIHWAWDNAGHFGKDLKPHGVTEDAISRWMQVSFFVINLLKLCYFGRSIEFFQSYMYIISRTIKGMLSFMAILMFFSICFSVMYIGAGINTPGYDGHTQEQAFPKMSMFVKFVLYGFSNTVGDISLPEFDLWADNDTNPVSSASMIVLGLLVNYC